MAYIDLLWQLPAIFTAVPMLARLLPFRLPARAVPLFYFIIALIVMAVPGYVCLALGAAGLISAIHLRLGEKLTAIDPPDMSEVANKLALAWDYIVTHLPDRLRLSHKTSEVPSVDDSPEDDNLDYAEPPRPPEAKITQRIPHLD